MISKKLCFFSALLTVLFLSFAGPMAAQEQGEVDDPFAREADQQQPEEGGLPFEAEPSTEGEAESPFDVPEEAESPFEQAPTGEVPPLPIDDPFATEPPEVEDPFAADDPFAQPPVPGEVEDPFAAETAPPAKRARQEAARIRGLYVLATQPGMQNFGQLQQLAEDFSAGEFNRLYGEARTVYGTNYASEFEKALPFITPGFTNPLLEVRELLSPESEVVAVVDLLPSYSAATGRRPPKENPLGRNPGLICSSIDGALIAVGNKMYLDPGNPDTRPYLQNLVLEINRVVKPNVILFRGVQYPGQTWGYSDGAVRNFRSQVGGSGDPQPSDSTWSAWRRHQLTTLLSDIRTVVRQASPDVEIGVYIPTDGAPPASWQEYQNSGAYADRMQDYLRWCREGIIDEIVFEVHERVGSQKQHLESWVNFANNNSYGTKPVISIGGYENFSSGVAMQYNLVRSRGVGTILYHYDNPLRSQSRGFFASLPNVVFRNVPGRAIPGSPITGSLEERRFAMMSNPPSAVKRTMPSPTSYINPLEEEPLVFASPTPVPTRTAAPVFVPEETVRKVTLVSGQRVDAVVLKVSPTHITLQETGGAPIEIARGMVETIEPPL